MQAGGYCQHSSHTMDDRHRSEPPASRCIHGALYRVGRASYLLRLPKEAITLQFSYFSVQTCACWFAGCLTRYSAASAYIMGAVAAIKTGGILLHVTFASQVTLVVPWLAKCDQELTFINGITFDTPDEQEKHMREWITKRTGLTPNYKVVWYSGIYQNIRRHDFFSDDLTYVPCLLYSKRYVTPCVEVLCT